MIKTQILWCKTKKCQKSRGNHKLTFFILNPHHWPVMQHAANFWETKKWSKKNRPRKKVISSCHTNTFMDILPEITLFYQNMSKLRNISFPFKLLCKCNFSYIYIFLDKLIDSKPLTLTIAIEWYIMNLDLKCYCREDSSVTI